MKKPSLYSDVECKTRVYHDLITIIKTNSDGQKKINRFFAVHKGSNLEGQSKRSTKSRKHGFCQALPIQGLISKLSIIFLYPKVSGSESV